MELCFIEGENFKEMEIELTQDYSRWGKNLVSVQEINTWPVSLLKNPAIALGLTLSVPGSR